MIINSLQPFQPRDGAAASRNKALGKALICIQNATLKAYGHAASHQWQLASVCILLPPTTD
jgi:hypothetical protein